MVSFPNAKINLGLFITDRLPNGYHTIESCLFPIPWSDVLEFVPSKKLEFNSSGIAIPGNEKDNLVLKAYKLLRKDFAMPDLSIHLHKIIPMGAGLGGGSSDASSMLKMINNEFQLFLEESILEDYALQLGSDCPFFIQNKPAIATGTGTDLTTIDFSLKGHWLVLIKPNIHVSTQEAYAGVTPKASTIDLEELIRTKDFDRWKEELTNDFETSIFPKHAILQELKSSLYESGAVYAAMSGSGSTIFGLFEQEPQMTSDHTEHHVKVCQL
ncbi:MAG: 4-diphosphocytidyl-2-C-methyl-D-erythritol kinase [Roseivirga sp.]|jgi:4-diphosphocytidyl-2-C-methyl-D-erythritol kinase